MFREKIRKIVLFSPRLFILIVWTDHVYSLEMLLYELPKVYIFERQNPACVKIEVESNWLFQLPVNVTFSTVLQKSV